MSKVDVFIEELEIESENVPGLMVDGVQATCRRCEHQTWSFGTGEKSRRRCLALLREQCPENERNFYVDEDE